MKPWAKCVFVILTVISSAAGASLEEANKVWKEYRACGKRTPQENLVSCARGHLSTSLVPPAQSKLMQFLDLGLEFTALQECPDQRQVLPTKKVAGEFYCMELKGPKRNGEGYVTFRKEDGQLKIDAIKFKY